jgi:alpha-L-fucosidase
MTSFDRRHFLRLAASGALLPSLFGAGAGCPWGLPVDDDFDPQRYLDAIREQTEQIRAEIDAGPYAADWASLAEVSEAPEWFRDAKFGIYFHWGVYSVPAFGSEWYPRRMHKKGHPAYKHHLQTYGSPADYPYTRFVPQFAAAEFDAGRWADLFERAGARYAGPVAEHHDGFAMWDSQVTPWNAAAMGPKGDVTGQLAEAVRERGMRFVTTFHHARNDLHWRQGGWDGFYRFAKKNFPSLFEEPKTSWMYGGMGRGPFLNMWLSKLGEVIDQYQPDLIWFDGELHEIPIEYRKMFLAHYYNRAKRWGKEVVVTRKGGDLPPEVSLKDFEKGRAADVMEHPWLTDDTITDGSWGYTQGMKIKPTGRVLHSLIDIVSKNGCLLLNVSPKASGVIPGDQRKVLQEIGTWLGQNGEAIYATRPWETYGEGPTELKEGEFEGVTDVEGGYTARDVRYTRSKDGEALYAIALGWPEGGELPLQSVAASGDPAALTARLIGLESGELQASTNDSGHVVIDVPDLSAQERPGQYAYVFELTGFDPVLHRDADHQGVDSP